MTLERIQLLHNHLTRLMAEPAFSTAAKLEMARAKSVLESAMLESQSMQADLDAKHTLGLEDALKAYEAQRQALRESHSAAHATLRATDIAVTLPALNEAHFAAVNLTPEHLALLQPLLEFIQPATPTP